MLTASSANSRRLGKTARSFHAPVANQKRISDTAAVKLIPWCSFKEGNRMESSAGKQQPMAGGIMAPAEQTYLRTELQQRRERLNQALLSPAADVSLSQLLKAVDAALSRIDQGNLRALRDVPRQH
jgi:hypothetical protein